MEFDRNIPIYVQIMDEIKRRIIAGSLQAGDKVPSVRDLADELQVNQNTIVRALQELEREGITETRRGMGTFVVGEEKMNPKKLKDDIGIMVARTFIQKMHEAGISDDEILSLISEAIKVEKK